MTKLQRLLKKCMEQNNPNAGTAESFNSSLLDLGRWVLTLYQNGNLNLENAKFEKLYQYDHININECIKHLGEDLTAAGYWNRQDRNFVDYIALCHSELSNALEEYRHGYPISYVYYRQDSQPKGVPAELSDVLIRIFIMCYQYDIDIEKALFEKLEYYKSKKYCCNKRRL